MPVLKLIAIAELALIAREHVARLNGSERRRLIQLVRLGRGRRRNLTEAERDELAFLVARMEPRLFAGHAFQKLSPVPLPGRLVYGRRRRK